MNVPSRKKNKKKNKKQKTKNKKQKSVGLMNHEMLHSVQYNYLEFLKKPNNVLRQIK